MADLRIIPPLRSLPRANRLSGCTRKFDATRTLERRSPGGASFTFLRLMEYPDLFEPVACACRVCVVWLSLSLAYRRIDVDFLFRVTLMSFPCVYFTCGERGFFSGLHAGFGLDRYRLMALSSSSFKRTSSKTVTWERRTTLLCVAYRTTDSGLNLKFMLYITYEAQMSPATSAGSLNLPISPHEMRDKIRLHFT